MPRDDKPLRERAKGRWRGLLPMFNVSPKILNGKHHPCPGCGGKDRFRFDDKEGYGTYYCSGCEPGDGIKLVQVANGWDFKTTAEKLEAVMGDVKQVAVRADRSMDKKRESQKSLWNGALAIRHKDPAGLYLQSRLGEIHRFPRTLKYSERTYFSDDRTERPAMLALVQDVDGVSANVHRTYLTEDGRKAEVEEVRKMMAGEIPKGSAVRLFPFYEDVLGVAEGIETAWSAHEMFDVPVWSTINAQMLAEWEPPKDVRKIIVFGDNDKSYTGQWASYALAKRLVKHGYEVEVRFPETVGLDWNDVWKSNFFMK